MTEALRMEQIYKAFPGVVAVDKVDLSVRHGEVVALVGENGAGKSTLMKILSGAYTCDSGSIFVDGQQLSSYDCKQAIDYGISTIYQELCYVSYMTVAENIYLSAMPRKKGLKAVIDKKEMNRLSMEAQRQVGIDYINPNTKLERLSVGERQLIEIAKAYARDAKIIVFDEPSSALNDKECEKLFELIEKMRKEGKAIIYISHKLDEIMRLADRVVVMRDGKRVGGLPIQEVTKDIMIQMMVGREVKDMYPKTEHEKGNTYLEVSGLTGSFLKNVSFHVRRGEIIGFFGLMGAGCEEIVCSLFGALPAKKTIKIDGKEVNIKNTQDAIKNGMAYVPAERKSDGLILRQSVKRNITMLRLNEIQRGLRLDKKKETALAKEWSSKLHVKTPSVNTPVESLSGGNQQKVVLAKWLMNAPDILILNEPTRGIDVGAKAEIYRLIDQFCEQGLAVIIVSSEMAEVMGVADRIYAVYNGEIRGEFTREEATQEKIMKKAIGE